MAILICLSIFSRPVVDQCTMVKKQCEAKFHNEYFIRFTTYPTGRMDLNLLYPIAYSVGDNKGFPKLCGGQAPHFVIPSPML